MHVRSREAHVGASLAAIQPAVERFAVPHSKTSSAAARSREASKCAAALE